MCQDLCSLCSYASLFLISFTQYLQMCPGCQALLGAEETRVSKSRQSFHSVSEGAAFIT